MLNLESLINKSRTMVSNEQGRFKHFSFICYKNSILSHGLNHPDKTHPLAFEFGFKYFRIHSEIASIVRFPEKPSLLKKCFIVNIRLGAEGQTRFSRPCQNCQRMLLSFGLDEIYYSNEYNQFEQLKLTGCV